MLSSKKYTLWGLKTIESHESPITEFVSLKKIDQKFYVELKKAYVMGSEMQPGVMRAQKRDIQISRVTYLLMKNVIFSLKKYSFRSFYMKL
jgi:hypothetical protein